MAELPLVSELYLERFGDMSHVPETIRFNTVFEIFALAEKIGVTIEETKGAAVLKYGRPLKDLDLPELQEFRDHAARIAASIDHPCSFVPRHERENVYTLPWEPEPDGYNPSSEQEEMWL
jgi:hypothetical protein